ncbi:endoplasmic reticulum-Golgi intermediate compartment protein 2 [Orussus abietinus]|uniref:endoplasmic reticulum-Golgi intermediate compartment protein 2 n=1 Tax=Orussus abietinus TaxID=222816 RepID=UPI00062645EE|nr:endoplasmic reticulum-Golgi intermediate compartment protein 2 [Orussus abietinus]
MLRRRNVNLKTVKKLDAFPKVPETCVEQSAVGGTFSVLSFFIIIYLIFSELSYFLDSRLQFKFEPDVDIDSKLKINIDITVAMRCNSIGADVLDTTNQHVMGLDQLQEEDTWWELTSDQRAHFEALKHMNSYLREEYHAIHELLWKSNQITLLSEMPKRTYEPLHAPDACHIYGSVELNKVAGNFHITAGKSISLPRGHIHISAYMTDRDYNFTHRIHRFSFGEPSPGIVHPLEGDEKITHDNMMLYQYFVEVVPTDIHTLLRSSKTYQYNVKDHYRPIDHLKGSHGIPGIFFKYDTSALKVKVIYERDSLSQFLVKLCATIGGVYVTSGLLNNLVQFLWQVINYHFLKNKDSKNDENFVTTASSEQKVTPPLNLLDITIPSNIDIMVKPQ